jgi:uncharacterized repeat protein (TIGR03803 family)
MKGISVSFVLLSLLALMAAPAEAQTNFTKLKSFDILPSGTDFIYPDGALYGVTPNGNATAQGTIFRINKDGSGYSVIFAFPGFAPCIISYETSQEPEAMLPVRAES